MIIDTSAVVAILTNEPDARLYAAAISQTAHQSPVSMSAATVVETTIVLDRHSNPLVGRGLESFLREAAITAVPLSLQQAVIARTAYRDSGRGPGHPAKLNFGDCFAYALAIDRNEPLLYKGTNFNYTDVLSALEPEPAPS